MLKYYAWTSFSIYFRCPAELEQIWMADILLLSPLLSCLSVTLPGIWWFSCIAVIDFLLSRPTWYLFGLNSKVILLRSSLLPEIEFESSCKEAISTGSCASGAEAKFHFWILTGVSYPGNYQYLFYISLLLEWMESQPFWIWTFSLLPQDYRTWGQT